MDERETHCQERGLRQRVKNTSNEDLIDNLSAKKTPGSHGSNAQMLEDNEDKLMEHLED